MKENLLDVGAVAARLGLSKEQIYRLARAGEIPAYRVGGLWRFDETEISQWLAGQKAPSAKDAVAA